LFFTIEVLRNAYLIKVEVESLGYLHACFNIIQSERKEEGFEGLEDESVLELE